MNQIDKILPTKEEVDELLGELSVLPEGLKQRPEPVILVGNRNNAEIISEVLNENL